MSEATGRVERLGPSPIIQFYSGGTDDRGRRLDDILNWDDDALEGVHDYIQWLFPLDEPSAFNPDAPIMTAADRAAFTTDLRIRSNVERAFARMLRFYGFQRTNSADQPVITRGDRWDERSRHWLRRGNHNFLRLTRLMKSLTLAGRADLAKALFDALAREYDVASDVIGATTFRFWQQAVRADPERPT